MQPKTLPPQGLRQAQLTTAVAALVAFVSVSSTAWAQATTATVLGTVVDESRAMMPGVTVSLTNVETGITRTVVTDTAGRYHASNLPPGDYQVQGELQGFQTVTRSGIHLTVGREAVVDLTLPVGQIADRIVVTGEAPLVNTQSATLSGLVDGKTMRDLPINGRDLLALTTLSPGVLQLRNTTQDFSGNYGIKLSVAGARPTTNNFMIDGSDANDASNRSPGSVAGVMLGTEAIREFSVLTHNYSAEYGRAAGGVVNMVSRSGTNEFHGSVFAFHRNSNLDARNFFDRGDPPPFHRHQYGFAFGGPVLKNRTFFFANYEGLRQELGHTYNLIVPNEAARAGRLPGVTPFTVHPNIVPFLALYPLPNGADFGDGTGEYVYSVNQPTTENFVTARVDHRFNERDSMFARFTTSGGHTLIPANDVRYFANSERTRSVYVTIEETKILGARTINVARVGYNRSDPIRQETAFETDLHESLSFVPGRALGDGRVTGIARFFGGDAGLQPERNLLNLFEVSDDISWRAGNHGLKAGVNYKRLQFNHLGPGRVGGRLRFPSLETFLRGLPDRFELVTDDSTWDRYWRESLIGMYLQDDWRAAASLTINVGLRYEFITVPTEKYDRIASLRDVAQDSAITVGPPLFENPSLKNFAPRLGFAWDLTGTGKTAVRGGFGVFHDQILLLWLRTAGSRMPPFFTIKDYRNPRFPDLTAGTGSPQVVLNTFPFDMNNPYMVRYNVNVQHEILPLTVLTAGYSGSRGIHVGRIGDANHGIPQIVDGAYFFPQGTPRLNPNFGEVRMRAADVDSFYHSLLVSLSRRFNSGVTVQGSYTFSRSIDDASGTQTAGDYETEGQLAWFDPKMNRGLSAFHVAHAFKFNGTYDLPFGANGTGPAALLAKGWQVSGIVTLATGQPFSILQATANSRDPGANAGNTRPNLVPGASNNPVLGGPDQYYDPTVFTLPAPGRYGNLGRNTVIGPGFASVDLSAVKAVNVRKMDLQFRFELFNALNRPNFGIPDFTALDAAGRVRATAGRITTTSSSARQMQLGVKLIF